MAIITIPIACASISVFPKPYVFGYHDGRLQVSVKNDSLSYYDHVWIAITEPDGTLCDNKTVPVYNDGLGGTEFTIQSCNNKSGTWTAMTNASGDGTTDYFTFEVGNIREVKTESTVQIGLNYYTSIEHYLTFDNGTMPRTYQFKFMLDDIHTARAKPLIADVDSSGENEVIFFQDDGKARVYNWTGLKISQVESTDSDRGQYYTAQVKDDTLLAGDINNNGIREIVINEYTGRLLVLEYDGDTWTQVFREGTDRGNYRSAPDTCDLDGNGNYEIISCAYNGVCRVYNWTGATFEVVYTSSDLGTNNYANHPVCDDLDNDGDNEWAVGDYTGLFYFFNYTDDNKSELVFTSADHGAIYAEPYVGKLKFNDTNNYILVSYTGGVVYYFNCTRGQTGVCDEADVSNDVGSIVYNSGHPQYINTNGYYYVYFMTTAGEPTRGYIEDSSTAKLDDVMAQRVNEYGYTRLGIPKLDDLNQSNIFIYSNRYSQDVLSASRNETFKYDTDMYEHDVMRKFYGPNYYNGFWVGGWGCGQIDSSTPEDECIMQQNEGIPLIYTYQNITEYHLDMYDDYELSMLDIMPRSATQYAVGNRTYCVNEEENVLLHSLGTGDISSFASVKNLAFSSISNSNRLTDGVLSTNELYADQNSIDYVDIGSNAAGFYFNITKEVVLGQLRIWNNFGNEHDMIDLMVNISTETCTNPDTNTWTSVFDEDDGNSNRDITGASSYHGTRIRFIPQKVGCIKIASKGAIYAEVSRSTTNRYTELAGYYANNCTFYYVPVNIRGTDINSNYNMSSEILPMAKELSPNQHKNNYQDAMFSPIAHMLEVISRYITWIKKY